ncbi:MAG: hypothetical protein IPF98_22165 [Gemmatimonadetes bacterium]|nr:hypothetical protein [Gemmatimonadota bacterium]
MLRTHDLVQLATQYRERRVLTVYLHTAVTDPAAQRIWEVELEHALEPLRRRIADADHGEREDFYAAVALLRQWLVSERASLGAPGVVLAVAPREVLFATATATAVPNTAQWGYGVFLAPLLHDVSLGAPSAVLVVDLQLARLCRFTPPRHLETFETLESDAVEKLGDVEHRLGAGRSNMGRGTRGGTAADVAERTLETGRDRLYARAIERATDLAGAHGWIVIGGTTRSVAAARALVPTRLHDRLIALDHLDVQSGDSAIAAAVAAAINEREGARDQETVREIIEEFGARGRGVIGLEATRAMLERESVADLLLSERFVSGHPQVADELLDRALGQGATVRQVHGEAASAVDREADGVAARLRYPISANPPTETSS